MGNFYIVNYIKRVLLLAFICTFLIGASPPSFAEEFSEKDFYDLIFEVKRDRETLSRAVFGLEKSGKYYIPIQTLAHIIAFKADTDLNAGTVQGFIQFEKNSYSLNVNEGTYTLKGKTESFNKDDALVLEQKYDLGDVYVTPALLNKIWPLDLFFNPLEQTLSIRTKTKLPYQMAAERQKQRNKRFNKKNHNEDIELDLPRIENNYKLFSLPALNFSSTTRFSNSKNAIEQNLNISGRNDFLKTQAAYNFSFDKEKGDKFRFENARFILERKSYEDGDIPLGLKLFQAGDVRPRPSRLIDGSLRGRGFLFSTEPQKQIRNFDQITVEGTAEPGWEVELYRNQELIDFQIVDAQGEYRFENVSLNFNKTVIRTILYGPEGQIQETKKEYDISSSMLQAGKTTFEASVLDLNHDLILTHNMPKKSPTGLAQNYKINHGIASWLSAFTTFTDTPTKQDDRRYATLGFNLSLLGVSSLLEVYHDFSGGNAFDFRAAGRAAGANINLRTAFLSDFESQNAGFDNAAKTSDIEFTVSRPFKVALLGNLGFRFKFDHEKFKSNPNRTEFDISETYSGHGLRITHGNSVNLTDRKHQRSDGRINTTYRINPQWQLRSLLNYDIFPERSFRNILAELRYKNRNKFTASADINRDFQTQGTRLGGQLSYDFNTFRTGLDVDWGREEGFRAFLRASFSMAPYGKKGDYLFSSQNLTNKAALNGRVFLDKDYDGKFSAGDEFIEDAKLNIGKRQTNPSDNEGYATYIGSPKNEYENISLDFDSLQDPFMTSQIQGYNTVLRPATAPFIDFPVIETGTIDGTVYTQDGPLAAVRLELLKDDEVIDGTTSAFDGFYTFEYVEPGTYVIRIDPSHTGLSVPPKSILVTAENLFHYNIDFQITTPVEEEHCDEEDETCLARPATNDILTPAQSLWKTFLKK